LEAAELWAKLQEASQLCTNFWPSLATAAGEEIHSLYQAAWLACEARRQGITHLHAHFGTIATTVARLAARFAGITYSFTAHAKDIFHRDVVASELRDKLRDAAAVITVSNFNAQHLRDTFGESAARLYRVYNGLDLQKFPFSPPAERLPRIVSVGRLVEKKGFATLIQACACLDRRGCPFDCDIIGAGELEAQLQALIRSLGLEQRVRLLGPRPQPDVIQHIRRAAVLAAPCLLAKDGNRDGLPTVLLEAMALGTPCVSTDVTGIPEIVHHDKTGLLVPQRDPERLAEAIERLLQDEPLRLRLARHARRLVEADFDICINAAQLRQLWVNAAPAIHPEEVQACA